MYLYTPKASIIKRLSNWKTSYEHAHKLLAYLKDVDYITRHHMETILWGNCYSGHYTRVKFWSMKRREFIPIKGYLFPTRKFFNEETSEKTGVFGRRNKEPNTRGNLRRS